MTRYLPPVLLIFLILMVLPFGHYSLFLGVRGPEPDGPIHLFAPDGTVPTLAIRLHMLTGAALTVGVALQVIAPLRRRWPVLHRWNGRTMAMLGLVTALAGLVYIGLRGTIGGPVMSIGFAVYGSCLALSAGALWQAARRGDIESHRRWALRFFVLAIASWIYRVHYGLWEITTGGIWRADDFSGLFDRINIFAFYLPYLFLVELWLRWRPRV